MKYAKKMTLVPYQTGAGTVDPPPVEPESVPQSIKKKENSIRKYAADRQAKLVKVIFKLAKTGHYDVDDGIFTSQSGNKLEFVPLLLYCFSPGKHLKGLDDFVDSLHQAGVKPDDVINATVQQMLASKQPGTRASSRLPTPAIQADNEASMPSLKGPYYPEQMPEHEEPMEMPPLKGPFKRKADEDDDESVLKPPTKIQKSFDWDEDDSDL